MSTPSPAPAGLSPPERAALDDAIAAVQAQTAAPRGRSVRFLWALIFASWLVIFTLVLAMLSGCGGGSADDVAASDGTVPAGTVPTPRPVACVAKPEVCR